MHSGPPPGDTCPDNPFDLYEEEPGWELASRSILLAVEDGLKKYPGQPDAIYDYAYPTVEEHANFGACDTASRDSLRCYIDDRCQEESDAGQVHRGS